ncbi:two-component sensor histidine kinase, partial [Pseudomonas aeruginosa]
QQLMLVKGQLDQLNRLVGDLHLLSLARAGQLAMEKYQFSVNELISERLEWAAPQIVAAGVVVQVNAVREFTLMADRDR